MIGELSSKPLIVLWLVFGSILCNDEYDSRITYPGPFNSGRGNHYSHSHSHSQSTEMSLETEIRLAQEYNQIENITDFISHIDGIPPDLDITGTSIANRFADDGRSNVELPKEANCTPELQSVSLRNSTVSSLLTYIPRCTRVYRCGGCCGHSTLSCEPTAKITRNFQVVITSYDVNLGRWAFQSKEIVLIEEHTKCACGCKTKAHHCNEKQDYKIKECRCACTNIDEATKCRRNNETRRWDEDSCSCKCRGPTECTTGSYYDHNDCSCKRLGLGGVRRHAITEQRTYSSRNDIGISQSHPFPPIFAVRADDPRRRQKDDPEV